MSKINKELKQIIPKVLELLNQYPVLEKKYENMQKAMLKNDFEKVFWQRKCKLYIPNRMEGHYKELDEELKKAGLFIEKEDK